MRLYRYISSHGGVWLNIKDSGQGVCCEDARTGATSCHVDGLQSPQWALIVVSALLTRETVLSDILLSSVRRKSGGNELLGIMSVFNSCIHSLLVSLVVALHCEFLAKCSSTP